MHNPEVIKFPAPECRLSHGRHQWDEGKGKSWSWLVDQHPFNTQVSLLMPDSPTLPGDLRELLTEDTQFYRVSRLPLHELCAPVFLQAFLSKGQVFALSSDTRLDLDNTAALTPNGLLRLLLDRLTYQELSLSGVLSAHILRTPPDRFVVEVDLKNLNFYPGKPYYHRVLSAFTRLPLSFSFWLVWLPDDPGVCPSSIAKYFHDLGYSVEEREAVLSQEVVGEALMPFLSLSTEKDGTPGEEEDREAEPEDLLEWIGCQTLGIKLCDPLSEPNIPGSGLARPFAGRCGALWIPEEIGLIAVSSLCVLGSHLICAGHRFSSKRSHEKSVLSSVVEPRHGTPILNLCSVQCSGLFPPSLIHLLIKHLRSWLAQRDAAAVPWVSLTVYGHPDSLVSWGRQEHSFHTTGDNLYVLVVARECLFTYQLQGSAKPQRLYVKTNKTK